MEDNGFQALARLDLKEPKLPRTGNEHCPAAEHRRAQKYQLPLQPSSVAPKSSLVRPPLTSASFPPDASHFVI